ncbi:hypothetical protein KIH39_17570 [Telmatocola sphagniphila]|uniref:DUF4203 domain-containing protein n=1 Tax=Telmatocola sphagniphila TaxID=1123043 RepID=A0A8E6B3J0_9BACT|nr:hypothetical protein [Telmatocola sphagniphila]QVL30654.1 hypothetical protein KIH39_17570 [Telmatocola sphagniphila]
MNLLDADLLAETAKLSPPALGFGLTVGVLVWLFGWRWHRFWVVLTITIIGGLAGLRTGQIVGGHMLAFGLLLAISAGLLALELARLLSFLIGGVLCALIVQNYFPEGQERWLAFLVGGLFSVLLYRLGTMAISSFSGTLLALYCGAGWLLQNQPQADWTEKNRVLFHAILISSTLVGVLVQTLMERWVKRRAQRKKDLAEQKLKDAERERKYGLPDLADPKKMLERLTSRPGD